MPGGRLLVLVFDAYPLAAVLLGEASGRAVGRLLVDAIAQGEAAVSAANLAEVVDLVARAAMVDPVDVLDAVELWVDGGLRVEALTWELAARAASLRAVHYHRSRCPISLADCAAIALAEHLRASLVTSDQPLAQVAALNGIDVVPVPDSRGTVPSLV